MPSTPVGKVGRIVGGDEGGRYVEVLDDTDGSTGGAYVCTWVPGGDGHDDWVESVEEVDAWMTEAAWTVEWLDVVPDDAAAGRPRHA